MLTYKLTFKQSFKDSLADRQTAVTDSKYVVICESLLRYVTCTTHIQLLAFNAGQYRILIDALFIQLSCKAITQIKGWDFEMRAIIPYVIKKKSEGNKAQHKISHTHKM